MLICRQRLLDHLGEAGYYSEKDLESLGVTIEKMRSVVERAKDNSSTHLLTLLAARLDKCDKLLALRREKLKDLSPQLAPIYEKTISILRSIAAANTKCKVGLVVTVVRIQLITLQVSSN